MKVAFHLRRARERGPTTGLLLLSHDSNRLLRLCAQLGLDPLPPIFAVQDGFLLKLELPLDKPVPPVLRLRRLSPNLFLPADAELVPTLSDDEARGLVRDRGLVFLPGGRILGFTPDRPVPLGSLLTATGLRRQEWASFPSPRQLAERIEEIRLDLPPISPDDFLAAGNADIGSEAPRPPASNVVSGAVGGMGVAAGRALIGLGQMLRWRGLVDLGARWLQNAVTLVPRLSEAVLGRQEAALRDLLRRFREGKTEEALRRALPLGAGEDRGGIPAGNAELPFHNLLYSLRHILGDRNAPASIWLGGFDAQAELSREYHKAAEEAAQRGDYRRAAFIYGKLLRDYQLAANVLLKGGLARDAALICLEKLNDPRMAAQAFVAAGDFDRALELYRQCGDHVAAADLLRQMGEEEEAIQEYLMAAEKMIAAGKSYEAAGDLLLKRANQPYLAQVLFEAGWNKRPDIQAIPCLFRLAEMFADRKPPAPFLNLVGEAEEFFHQDAFYVPAGRFYNLVAQLASRPALAEFRVDLRDRALNGLGEKIRQRVAASHGPGDIVSQLLGESSNWDPALVSDAAYAVKAAFKDRRESDSPHGSGGGAGRIRLKEDVVTAACHAPRTGDLFVGFATGEVVCYSPLRSDMIHLLDFQHPITALAADEEGELVVVLAEHATAPQFIASLLRKNDFAYQFVQSRVVDGPGPFWLTPHIVGGFVGLWNGEALKYLADSLLTPQPTPEAPTTAGNARHGLLGLLFGKFTCWLFCGNATYWRDANLQQWQWRPLGWTPREEESGRYRSVPVSLLRTGQHTLELAGVDDEHHIHLMSFEEEGDRLVGHSHLVSKDWREFEVAALIRSGLVAAVGKTWVVWLKRGIGEFVRATTTKLAISQPVACFPSPRTNEVLVVCADGWLVRVPVPV